MTGPYAYRSTQAGHPRPKFIERLMGGRLLPGDPVDLAVALTAIGTGNLTTDWLNVRRCGAKGDGVTDDTGAINSALAAGNPVVYFPHGGYATSGPLLNPYGTLMLGPLPAGQSGDGISPAPGAVIKPASSFSSALAHPGAVVFGDGTGSNIARRMGMFNMVIDLSNITPGTQVSGITAFGAINAATVAGVGIYGSPYRGIEHQPNGASFPDGWHIHDVIIQAPNDVGMYGKFVDTTGSNIHVQSGGSIGWLIQGANNRWTNARSDLCASHGFQIDAPSGDQGGGFLDANIFVGGGTQRNTKHGMLVQNGSATGTSTRAPVVLAGCTFDGDGVNGGAGGGGFAGLALGGAVVVTGECDVLVHTEDVAGGCPTYAVTTFQLGTAPGKPQLLQLRGLLNAASATIINDGAPVALRQVLAAGLASAQYGGASSLSAVT